MFGCQEINKDFKSADLAICVGAWDTVNPVAAEDPESPVYGMPMCRVWEAKTCIVNKRSLPKKGRAGGGFSGAQNTLPHKENTRMLLGNAKNIFSELASAIGAEADEAGAATNTGGVGVEEAGGIGATLEELMAMPVCKKLAVPRESEPRENRCAITPVAAANLRRMGFEVYVDLILHTLWILHLLILLKCSVLQNRRKWGWRASAHYGRRVGCRCSDSCAKPYRASRTG